MDFDEDDPIMRRIMTDVQYHKLDYYRRHDYCSFCHEKKVPLVFLSVVDGTQECLKCYVTRRYREIKEKEIEDMFDRFEKETA